MACYYPVIIAEQLQYVNGQRVKGKQTKVPCGKCIGCRLEYSRQWALRCHHEAFMHEENSFVTLTYNDDNLPDDMSVHKDEIRLFMKRLRKKFYPKEIRYYGCGEYGSNFDRPHYHLCLFGHDFEDKEIYRSGSFREKKKEKYRRSMFDIYRSKTLEQIWKKGFSTVGEMTFESAAYVARYVTKKITGPPAKDHYKGRNPEFAVMSRRPGIGTSFVEKYANDIYPKDFVTLKGRKLRPVRFYDNKLMQQNFDMYEKIKKKRSENTENLGETRLYQMEQHKKAIIKPLQRRLEYGETEES